MEKNDNGFDHPEDRIEFERLFRLAGGLEENKRMFDFRDPAIKRKEFNKIRNTVFRELRECYGDSCQLRCHPDCGGIGVEVDHVIPLASNILNKTLRGMKGEDSKKVPKQSFGSNHISNFILACSRCNAFKKHRLPDEELLSRVRAIQAGGG